MIGLYTLVFSGIFMELKYIQENWVKYISQRSCKFSVMLELKFGID
jgi:hypothetical protein